jgi:hypothetical protein
MARTAVERLITFDPSSQLTDYLGVGYSTQGVALASLMSLSPIYPSRTSFSKYDKKRQWVRQPLLPPSTGWQPAHTLGMPKSFALGLQSNKRLQT